MISALKMIADRIADCGVEQAHDVQDLELRVECDEHRRDDREIFGNVVGDGEGRQRAARHQQLLADLDDLDELGRVAVEVDHVAGLARGDRACVHGDADVGLRQRGGVVGAIAAHGDQLALGLFRTDQLQLVFGRSFGKEIVDAGFGRNRCRCHRIVAGDHHRADAHAAQFGEAFADAALDDVLQVDDAEQAAVARHRERCAAHLARSRRRWRGFPGHYRWKHGF